MKFQFLVMNGSQNCKCGNLKVDTRKGNERKFVNVSARKDTRTINLTLVKDNDVCNQ